MDPVDPDSDLQHRAQAVPGIVFNFPNQIQAIQMFRIRNRI